MRTALFSLFAFGRAPILATVVALALLAACAGPSRNPPPAVPSLGLDPAARSNVVLTAVGLLETRYQYGGSHPVRGFDCSGLVAYVFHDATDQTLPHNTAAIAKLSRPISRKKLQAGDFVFFNTLNRPFSHMGIYIGDGQFVNAPSTGGQVRIDRLDNPYFAQRFESARTVFTR